MTIEPRIQIGDRVLDDAQARMVRFACVFFEIRTSSPEGRNDYGPAADDYSERLREVIGIMADAARKADG